MSTDESLWATLGLDDVEDALGRPVEEFAFNCHVASVALVTSGLFHRASVARGTCRGVMSQHSWVTLGDPYDPGAPLVDITLWSYDPGVEKVWTGTMRDGHHRPHGYHPIDEDEVRAAVREDPIPINTEGLSAEAMEFLDQIGPLDTRGWQRLVSGGMLGWPSRELLPRIKAVRGLAALIPIDIIGMLTDEPITDIYPRRTA